MTTTWIVIADSRGARVVERREPHGPLQEVERFINAAEEDDGGTGADHFGTSYGRGDVLLMQTAEAQVLPVQEESDRLARTVTAFLSQAKAQNRYDQIYLVAAPAFLGLLRGHLHEEVQRMVEEELPGDVASFDARRIEQYLDGKFD